MGRPGHARRGRLAPGVAGRDDLVIYDTQVRGVVARVPLNGQRLGNPIIPLEDAVYWREYDDSADVHHGRWPIWFATTCRPEPGLECRGRTNAPPRLGRRGHPASSWAPPTRRTRPRNSPSSTRKSVSRPVLNAPTGRPSWQRRANACGSASPTGTTARRCTCSSGWTTTGSRSWLGPRRRTCTDRRPARVPHLRRPVPHRRLRRAGLAASRTLRRRRRGGLT